MTLDEIFKNTKAGDVGIIGDPVEHSLSPLMHNSAFQTWWGAFRDRDEKTPEYHKFHIKPSDLAGVCGAARKHELRGFNVTVPHKVAIIPFLDNLDPFAQKVGSVNTVSFTKEGSMGYNTDGDGFSRALSRDLNFEPMGKKVLVLGAGGTGRVIVQKLIDSGAVVSLWNRSPETIKKLLSTASEIKTKVEVVKSAKDLASASIEADLIVNATSVGLSPEDGLPADNLKFKPGQYAVDVIYHRETRFLQEAAAQGAVAKGGLSMLVYQGARSFEIWTGAPAPVEIMWAALSQDLKKDTN